jgi:hypothetical protein
LDLRTVNGCGSAESFWLWFRMSGGTCLPQSRRTKEWRSTTTEAGYVAEGAGRRSGGKENLIGLAPACRRAANYKPDVVTFTAHCCHLNPFECIRALPPTRAFIGYELDLRRYRIASDAENRLLNGGTTTTGQITLPR